MAIDTPELVQRNATFAAGGAFKGLPFPTNPALRVIGCVDSRVDPSDVLGLNLGEAVVMRNVGGRAPAHDSGTGATVIVPGSRASRR
jgi:carbonic anhydrase